MNDKAGQAFVALTDVLVDVDHTVDLSKQAQPVSALCVEMLDVAAVGVLAVDGQGALEVVSASEETAELLSRFELVYDEGPALDAFRTGARVECTDLTSAVPRWPRFAAVALEAGVVSAHGLPCRLRDRVVGALSLYLAKTGTLSPEDAEVGRGVANAVSLSIGAAHWRAQQTLATQLQGALDSRVAIEQAKGVLAERAHISVDDAFALLRAHARGTGTKVQDVARDVVSGELTLPVN
jgi:hypothetical protein